MDLIREFSWFFGKPDYSQHEVDGNHGGDIDAPAQGDGASSPRERHAKASTAASPSTSNPPVTATANRGPRRSNDERRLLSGDYTVPRDAKPISFPPPFSPAPQRRQQQTSDIEGHHAHDWNSRPPAQKKMSTKQRKPGNGQGGFRHMDTLHQNAFQGSSAGKGVNNPSQKFGAGAGGKLGSPGMASTPRPQPQLGKGVFRERRDVVSPGDGFQDEDVHARSAKKRRIEVPPAKTNSVAAAAGHRNDPIALDAVSDGEGSLGDVVKVNGKDVPVTSKGGPKKFGFGTGEEELEIPHRRLRDASLLLSSVQQSSEEELREHRERKQNKKTKMFGPQPTEEVEQYGVGMAKEKQKKRRNHGSQNGNPRVRSSSREESVSTRASVSGGSSIVETAPHRSFLPFSHVSVELNEDPASAVNGPKPASLLDKKAESFAQSPAVMEAPPPKKHTEKISGRLKAPVSRRQQGTGPRSSSPIDLEPSTPSRGDSRMGKAVSNHADAPNPSKSLLNDRAPRLQVKPAAPPKAMNHATNIDESDIEIAKPNDVSEESRRRPIQAPKFDDINPKPPMRFITQPQDDHSFYQDTTSLAKKFVRDESDHPPNVKQADGPPRTIKTPKKIITRASPIRDSFDDSPDELSGAPTVRRHASPRRSPPKQPTAPEEEPADLGERRVERSPSQSDLKTTQFKGLPGPVDQGPVAGIDHGVDPARIEVEELYCKACVEKNVILVWNEANEAFHIEKAGQRLLVYGTKDPITLGFKEMHEWHFQKDVTWPVAYIRGSSNWNSSGKILIQFASDHAMMQCFGHLSDGVKTITEPAERMRKIFKVQGGEIKQDHTKSIRVRRGEMTTLSRPGLIDDEEIKYDYGSDEQAEPPAASRRESMKTASKIGQTKPDSSSRLKEQDETQSHFFTDKTRSSRQTRARTKPPTPPTVQKWTKIHKPKPWPHAITYPSEGKERVTVAFEDLERLDEEEFLNDNVIAFGLRRIQEQMSPEHRKDVYFFNSFFFTRMTEGHNRKGINYDAVKRWTKREDIFSYPYLVMPINFSLHWFVAIICNLPNLKRRVEGLEDGDEEEMLLKPDGPPVASQDGGLPAAEGVKGLDEAALNGSAIEIEDSQDDPMQGVVQEENGVVEVKDSQKDATTEGDTQAHVPLDQPIVEARMSSPPNGPPSVGDPPNNDIEMQTADLPASQPPSRPGSAAGKARGKKKATHAPRGFDPDGPSIITLDSFGTARAGHIRDLKLYIQAEGKEKRQLTVDVNELQGITAKGIPEQPNFSDCGVYLLGYVEEFAKDPRKFVTRVLTRQMDRQSDFAGFSPAAKRQELRDAILELAPK